MYKKITIWYNKRRWIMEETKDLGKLEKNIKIYKSTWQIQTNVL